MAEPPSTGRPLPYVYVNGIYLRRNWGGAYENVAILVAIAVNEDGYREVLGAEEGMKEDKASWVNFFQWLRGRDLDGVKLVVGDKCLGIRGNTFITSPSDRVSSHNLQFLEKQLYVPPPTWYNNFVMNSVPASVALIAQSGGLFRSKHLGSVLAPRTGPPLITWSVSWLSMCPSFLPHFNGKGGKNPFIGGC